MHEIDEGNPRSWNPEIFGIIGDSHSQGQESQQMTSSGLDLENVKFMYYTWP